MWCAMSALVLIRGLPGSGKSTMARAMPGYSHYEADMFFDVGGYKFDVKLLPNAHAWCLNAAKRAMRNGMKCVVSNTFTRNWEMEPYIEAAAHFGVPCRIIEARGNWPNIHSVPEDVIDRMRARWEPHE